MKSKQSIFITTLVCIVYSILILRSNSKRIWAVDMISMQWNVSFFFIWIGKMLWISKRFSSIWILNSKNSFSFACFCFCHQLNWTLNGGGSSSSSGITNHRTEIGLVTFKLLHKDKHSSKIRISLMIVNSRWAGRRMKSYDSSCTYTFSSLPSIQWHLRAVMRVKCASFSSISILWSHVDYTLCTVYTAQCVQNIV